MHDHAGSLIHHDDRIVLVKNFNRDILRRGALARHLDLAYGDPPAGSQLERRLAILAVDTHVAGVDRAAQRGSAERGQLAGQKNIEPLARLIGRDLELKRPGSGNVVGQK
jgi:hypothetical protein